MHAKGVVNVGLITTLVSLLLVVGLWGISKIDIDNLAAPREAILSPATTTDPSAFTLLVGTSSPQTAVGTTTLFVYGSTTIQTWDNTEFAFMVLNSASTSVFQVDTQNSSTTFNGNTATTTMNSGLHITSNHGFRAEDLVSCDTIDTDSSGFLRCGSDGGGSSPDILISNFGTSQYLTASSSVEAWYFDDGFISNASSTINADLTVTGSATTTAATTTDFYVSGTFALGGDIFTDLTGWGLSNSSNVLTVDISAANVGSNWAFTAQADALAPTTSPLGLVISASSTIDGGLNVIGGATSTNATTTGDFSVGNILRIGGDDLSELCGTGLTCTSNTLTLNATGDWTGTFDGQEGTYYIARANHTGTQAASTITAGTFGSGNYVFNGNIGFSSTTPGVELSVTGNGVIDGILWVNDFWATSTLRLPLNPVYSVSLNATGTIAYDETDNQFLVSTSSYSSDLPAVLPTIQKLFSAAVSSTSVEFFNGGVVPLPVQRDGFDITEIYCYTDGGTSAVINLDLGTGGSNTDTVTCDSDGASDTAMAAVHTFAAQATTTLEVGAITGAVDYIVFSVYGFFTRE